MKYLAVGMIWIGYAAMVIGVSYFTHGNTGVVVTVVVMGAFAAFGSARAVVEN